MDSKQLYTLIDDLVTLDSEIKALEKRKQELKEQVIALGEGNHPGHLGSVSVALQNRKTLSADKVKALLTEPQLESCYTTGSSIVVRVTPFTREGQ